MEYFRQRFLDELNEEGDIEIRGLHWSRQEVLERMDRDGYNQLFIGWVDDAKQAAKERVAEFLKETDCLDRFRVLINRYRKGHVVPFVGAGMCCPSGMPQWKEFLLSLCKGVQLRASVSEHLAQGHFEEAAQEIADALGPRRFSEAITNALGSHRQKVR